MHLEPFAAPFTAGPSRIGFVTSRSGESADSGERGEREERKSDDCGRGRRGRGRDRVEFVVLRRFCFESLSNYVVQNGESIWRKHMEKAMIMQSNPKPFNSSDLGDGVKMC